MTFLSLLQKARRKLSRNVASWETDSLGVVRRRYRSYESYLKHQRAKIRERSETVQRFDEKLARVLPQRISDLPLEQARVVCVASRRGGEVRAFRSLGAFAWGVDIAPGSDNAYTAFGDMHDLEEIPERSVDVAYTNSLDHAYDIQASLRAFHRILVPRGILILELLARNPAGDFESMRWDSAEALMEAFGDLTGDEHSTEPRQDSLFREVYRAAFSQPWPGLHVRLERASSPDERLE